MPTPHCITVSMASGTLANRKREAAVYIKFSLAYSISYLSPSVLDIAMYARFLGNSFKSPVSVKNYLSGARTWVQFHKGDVSNFSSPQVSSVVQGVKLLLNHVPSPAPALFPAHIIVICNYIDSHPLSPLAIKPAILLAYVCFLRNSNVLAPSLSSWGGPHTLKACDILPSVNGLYVIIRSTKTLKASPPTVLEVHAIHGSPICPVGTWHRYKNSLAPPPKGPAFILESGVSLTAKIVVQIMRLALKTKGYSNSDSVSMHSLRRGAAQTAEAAGAPLNDIMGHGTWKCKTSLSCYLKPTAVPSLMAKSLAN